MAAKKRFGYINRKAPHGSSYAQESLEFAEASHQAVTEAWQDVVVAIADGAGRNDG